MSAQVNEIIEQVLTDAICINGFDCFDERDRKELVADIVEALRKDYHIVPYAKQLSFE